MNKKAVLSIDIGGTNTKFGIVDFNGNILNQNVISTTHYPNINLFVDAILTKVREFNILSRFNLTGIGIGAPNGNFYSGSIEFAPNLLWEGKIPLAKMFTEKSGLPSILTNDANAAAIGEMKFGAAKNIKNFIFITLGTGVGSGIVVDGKLVYGHDGFAGEIGHVIVFPNGRQCGCGRQGCLEMYASVRGICITMKELMAKQNQTKLLPDNFTSKDIFLLAEKKNKIALEAFNITGEILGLALANSVAYTSPSHIFIFGGLAHSWKFIYPSILDSFNTNLLKIYKDKIEIKKSALKDSDAAILGGAAIIIDKLLE
jgi:glucokinase